MHITSEKDITAAVVKDLRLKTGLKQRQFWNAIGISQTGGCYYENGRTPMPETVRILVFTRYVAGLEIDAATPEGVDRLHRLAKVQTAETFADREQAGAIITEARAHIRKAIELLTAVAH